MTTIDLDVPRPEPRRDRYGRYLIKPAGGGNPRPYTRATTIAKALDDQSSLINWSMRMCALGLTSRKDLFAQIAACRPDDRNTLSRLVDQAKEAGGGSTGANLGTALHAFAERVDLGERVEIPDQWAADITAYTQTIDRHGLTVRRDLVEKIVVLEELGVAGTIDRVYQTADGRLVIGDLKTAQTLDFNRLAISIQLAIYAHADTLYDPATETHTPMVDVDKTTALVVHLPAERAACQIHEVDIAAGWAYVQLALQVRDARNHGRRTGDNLFRPYEPPATPQRFTVDPSIAAMLGVATISAARGTAYRAWIVDRLAAIRATPDAVKAMTANWPDGVPGLKTDHPHTVAELDQIAAALDKVEATFGIPFGDPDPRALKPQPRPDPPALPAPIDEGADLARDIIDTLIKDIDALPEPTRKQLNTWAGEAHKAGRAFSIKTRPSHRRWVIYQACINLAELGDPDMVRACLNTVAPDTAGAPVGAALGALTIQQANELFQLTITVKQRTPALVYGDDGAPRWEPLKNSNPTSKEHSTQ